MAAAGMLDQAGAQAFADKNAGRRPRALAVVERASGELVGHMDFHLWLGRGTREIGWAIGRPHQRQSYATEAAPAVREVIAATKARAEASNRHAVGSNGEGRMNETQALH